MLSIEFSLDTLRRVVRVFKGLLDFKNAPMGYLSGDTIMESYINWGFMNIEYDTESKKCRLALVNVQSYCYLDIPESDIVVDTDETGVIRVSYAVQEIHDLLNAIDTPTRIKFEEDYCILTDLDEKYTLGKEPYQRSKYDSSLAAIETDLQSASQYIELPPPTESNDASSAPLYSLADFRVLLDNKSKTATERDDFKICFTNGFLVSTDMKSLSLMKASDNYTLDDSNEKIFISSQLLELIVSEFARRDEVLRMTVSSTVVNNRLHTFIHLAISGVNIVQWSNCNVRFPNLFADKSIVRLYQEDLAKGNCVSFALQIPDTSITRVLQRVALFCKAQDSLIIISFKQSVNQMGNCNNYELGLYGTRNNTHVTLPIHCVAECNLELMKRLDGKRFVIPLVNYEFLLKVKAPATVVFSIMKTETGFVVKTSFTTVEPSGDAIVVDDSHLSLETPSVFYVMAPYDLADGKSSDDVTTT